MKRAICPGSFDPVTFGHIDIIKRAANMFDTIIVGVLKNTEKNTAFTIDERIDFLKRSLYNIKNVEIEGFDGLLADYARKKGIKAVVKGLRALSDFEYEFQMALINKKLNPEFETVFLTTGSEYMYLNSSMVKQVASFGGEISGFVPECIANEIKQRLYKGEYRK